MYFAELLLNILLLLLLIWICIFLINLVHEMGHVLMYRIFFREKDWNITIGVGRTIIKLKKFTLRIFPISGHYNYKSKYDGSKFQRIMTHLGGPLANVLFIVLLRFLLHIITANKLTFEQKNLVWFLTFTFWGNVAQFVFTAVPMKYSSWPYEGYISDGMEILNEVTDTGKS